MVAGHYLAVALVQVKQGKQVIPVVGRRVSRRLQSSLKPLEGRKLVTLRLLLPYHHVDAEGYRVKVEVDVSLLELELRVGFLNYVVDVLVNRLLEVQSVRVNFQEVAPDVLQGNEPLANFEPAPPSLQAQSCSFFDDHLYDVAVFWLAALLAHHAHCLLELCNCGCFPKKGLEEGQKLLVFSMV